jgi:AraC-like DNA-binding protein
MPCVEVNPFAHDCPEPHNMRTILPIIGSEALNEIPHLLDRVSHLIRKLGHEPFIVDAGNVLQLHEANPLDVKVPMVAILTSSISEELLDDLLRPIVRTFPSAIVWQGEPHQVPMVLNNSARSLSLCGDNEAPEVIKKTAELTFAKIKVPELSVAMIAQKLAVTKYKLEKEFNGWRGIGVGAMVRQIRMSEAKRLLQETQFPINEIAAALGYENLAAFDKVFRNFHTMSPTAVRQKSRSSKQKDN